MKRSICYITILCLLFCLLIPLKNRKAHNNRLPIFNNLDTDNNKINPYTKLYSELSWLENDKSHDTIQNSDNVYMMLKFLDAIHSGNYVDYLDFYDGKNLSERLSFKSFKNIHDQYKNMGAPLFLKEDEFKDVLSYSLVLKSLKNNSYLKDRLWIYGNPNLREVVLFYGELLPTLKRFNKKQKNFLSKIAVDFELEEFLERYYYADRRRISKNNNYRKKFHHFDLSHLIFICTMASRINGDNNISISDREEFYSKLNDFNKDMLIHLELSF